MQNKLLKQMAKMTIGESKIRNKKNYKQDTKIKINQAMNLIKTSKKPVPTMYM